MSVNFVRRTLINLQGHFQAFETEIFSSKVDDAMY